MREEFTIHQRGKEHVLYAGLLDRAHEMGLQAIATKIIQIPADENGKTAIVQAVVTMDPSEEGGPVRTFSGIGDADPQNVGRGMAPHILRLSETRAKARALRDATNVHASLLEDEPAGETSDATQSGRGEPASEEQIERLRSVIESTGHSVERFEERQKPLGALTKEEAARWIADLGR